MEPLITTELESAILKMHYEPTKEWVANASVDSDVVARERELNRQASLRVLDTLYEVQREFLHIELGLL